MMSGLFLSTLHAQNDPTFSNSGLKSPGSVNVTVLLSSYTYPTAISTDGSYVIGTPFGGGAQYWWSAGTGIVSFSGECYGVSDAGIVSGTYSNSSVLYNGNNVFTAGTWDPGTSAWTFLGMNPAVPNLFSTDYNVGYDITADGSTVVGMQWYPNYSVSAFKWTQAGGYQMIGTGVGSGSRPNGISANGSVVFGWAQVGSVNRTPVIWYNNQVIYINNSAYGEAFGASTTGNYVTGNAGSQGFLWSPQSTVYFSNTLNAASIYPTTVSNDGTVFGYTDSNPALRRAFARDPQGNLTSFNDYALARGLPDAQLWTFYSINDVTADGNTMIGAGKNPAGQNVTFIMEFIPEIPIFTATPTSINFGEIPILTQSDYREVKVTNTGAGSLVITSAQLFGSSSSHFVLADSNTYPVSLAVGDTMQVWVAFKPTTMGNKLASLQFATNAGNKSVQLSGVGGYGVGITDENTPGFQIYPIPANENLHLSYRTGIESVQLYNTRGQLVYTNNEIGTSTYSVQVQSLPEGSYLLVGKAIDGSTCNKTIIVNR